MCPDPAAYTYTHTYTYVQRWWWWWHLRRSRNNCRSWTSAWSTCRYSVVELIISWQKNAAVTAVLSASSSVVGRRAGREILLAGNTGRRGGECKEHERRRRLVDPIDTKAFPRLSRSSIALRPLSPACTCVRVYTCVYKRAKACDRERKGMQRRLTSRYSCSRKHLAQWKTKSARGGRRKSQLPTRLSLVDTRISNADSLPSFFASLSFLLVLLASLLFARPRIGRMRQPVL